MLFQVDAVGAETEKTKLAVLASYAQHHDGWSSDEVVLQDELNKRFLDSCQRLVPDATPAELNWTLLNLRKAGELPGKVTRRHHHKHDDYRHAAEIAARFLQDQFQLNVDRVLCDPKYRTEFDRVAQRISPDTSAYLLRKAAFGLRKARKLKPEFVVRIADWGRTITVYSTADLAANLDQIPTVPGVYIFRDSTGYLYIGESENLRKRLTKHLTESDRNSLAVYLRDEAKVQSMQIEIHAFASDSPAKNSPHRRAYESELIASRKPRFNVRP